jgi:protoporphyrin/coproporphyrin ferrochelatase
MFRRAPALNDEPLLSTAQAEIVADHLKYVNSGWQQRIVVSICCLRNTVGRRGEVCTPQYRLNCAGCTNPTCRTVLNPIGGNYSKLRDTYDAPSSVAKWP